MTIQFFLTIIFITFVQSRELPPYLKDLRCSLKQDFDKCFIENGNKAIPLVAKGDPDYGIPKLTPLEASSLQLISTPTLTMNMTNVKIYGLDQLKLIDHKFNRKQGLYTMMFRGKNITINGQYSVDGRIMIMPIKGNGPFSVFLDNGVYKVTNTALKINRDGEDYYHVSAVRVDYTFEKIVFNFENLFEGNEELGKQVNQFLNENWDLIVVDFGPGIGSYLGSVIKDINAKIADVVPVKKYFSD